MSRRPPLKIATEEDRPAKKRGKTQTVSEAAASGDHRALLVAMRDRISKAVSDPDCPPRDLAALTRRLQDIAKEIEQIDLRRKEEGEHGVSLSGDEDWNEEAI